MLKVPYQIGRLYCQPSNVSTMVLVNKNPVPILKAALAAFQYSCWILVEHIILRLFRLRLQPPNVPAGLWLIQPSSIQRHALHHAFAFFWGRVAAKEADMLKDESPSDD